MCSSPCSWLSVAVLFTTVVAVPAAALAQRVSGVLGVSATVLPPIMTTAVNPFLLRLLPNGVARLETTAPFAGAVSLIVMSTVSSSANGFVPVAQPPFLVKPTPRKELLEGTSGSNEAPRWWYDVDLGPRQSRSEANDVTVRITYLIVPGT